MGECSEDQTKVLLILVGLISNSWCDPFKTWSKVGCTSLNLLALTRAGDPFKAYTYDPLANLTKAQYHLVLGGESHELFK